MKSVYVVFILVLGGLIAGLDSRAMSQPRPFNFPARGEKMRERIRTIRTWKMVELMDLTEEQSQRFFPIMNRREDRERERNEKRHEIMRELRELVENKDTSDDELKKKIEEVRKNNVEHQENSEKFHKAVEKVLSVRQQAKLMFFEPRFERELRDIVRDFRHRRMGELWQEGQSREQTQKLEEWQEEMRRHQQEIRELQEKMQEEIKK